MRLPQPGEWFLWSLSLGFFALMNLMLAAFALDSPGVSSAIGDWVLPVCCVCSGVAAVIGLGALVMRGSLLIALGCNLGQVIATQAVLGVIAVLG